VKYKIKKREIGGGAFESSNFELKDTKGTDKKRRVKEEM